MPFERFLGGLLNTGRLIRSDRRGQAGRAWRQTSAAGSNQKHYHDEKTLEWKSVATVSIAYPFPYGFIVGTSADDGCNVDCFVLTDRPLRTGQVVDCQVGGLMEQLEDGHEDHNLLAVLPASPVDIKCSDPGQAFGLRHERVQTHSGQAYRRQPVCWA